jgi:GNAT superfamily N-acetyltransferase
MTDAASDRLVAIADLPPAIVDAARHIYEAGFPAAVRAPFADLLGGRDDERTQVLLDSAGDASGLVLVRDLSDTGWTFLRYFVVTAERRGQGVGGRLWSVLCADLAARGRTRLLFDVEDPGDPTADPHEAEERRRRVVFYRRRGADLVDVASYAPPHHGEPGTAPMPLRLMAAGLDAAGGSSRLELDARAADQLAGAVLQHRYGVPASNGPSPTPPEAAPH